jgi:membrane associated rhomboid family serine protease
MTIIIIAITAVVSVIAFYNHGLFDRFQFNAYSIRHRNEWYRFFTYGLLHADWTHLLINMLVLYSFGKSVESLYGYYFGTKALFYYLLLYAGGIVFSVLFDFGKHKDDIYYNAVGASGAVSAVVFTSILFHPTGRINFFFIPFGIPAVVFGILYLIFSAYMAKRAKDNVGHNAHFWGSVFGFVFTALLKPALFLYFIEEVRNLLH